MIDIAIGLGAIVLIAMMPFQWFARKVSAQKFDPMNQPFKLSFSYGVWLMILLPVVSFLKGYLSILVLNNADTPMSITPIAIVVLCIGIKVLSKLSSLEYYGIGFMLTGVICANSVSYGILFLIASIIGIILANQFLTGYLLGVSVLTILELLNGQLLLSWPTYLGLLIGLLTIFSTELFQLLKGEKTDLLLAYKNRHQR